MHENKCTKKLQRWLQDGLDFGPACDSHPATGEGDCGGGLLLMQSSSISFSGSVCSVWFVNKKHSNKWVTKDQIIHKMCQKWFLFEIDQ